MANSKVHVNPSDWSIHVCGYFKFSVRQIPIPLTKLAANTPSLVIKSKIGHDIRQMITVK